MKSRHCSPLIRPYLKTEQRYNQFTTNDNPLINESKDDYEQQLIKEKLELLSKRKSLADGLKQQEEPDD